MGSENRKMWQSSMWLLGNSSLFCYLSLATVPLCPFLCVRRNCLHLCPSLSIHTWSLAVPCPLALQPGCPEAGLPLTSVLKGFCLGSLGPDQGLVYVALDTTKACPTLTPSAVLHRPLQSPHWPSELWNPGGAGLFCNAELQAAAHLVHVNPQN